MSILDAESTCICYALRMFYVCFTWFRDLEFYAVVATLFGHLAIQFAPDFYYAEDLKSYIRFGPFVDAWSSWYCCILDGGAHELLFTVFLRTSDMVWPTCHLTWLCCVCMRIYVFQLFVCLFVCVFVVRACMLIIFSCFVHWASRCGGVVDFKGWIGRIMVQNQKATVVCLFSSSFVQTNGTPQIRLKNRFALRMAQNCNHESWASIWRKP